MQKFVLLIVLCCLGSLECHTRWKNKVKSWRKFHPFKSNEDDSLGSWSSKDAEDFGGNSAFGPDDEFSEFNRIERIRNEWRHLLRLFNHVCRLVKCSSCDHGFSECKIPDAAKIFKVKVVKQLSNAECEPKISFGIDENIWVTSGCRAIFVVCYKTDRKGSWGSNSKDWSHEDGKGSWGSKSKEWSDEDWEDSESGSDEWSGEENDWGKLKKFGGKFGKKMKKFRGVYVANTCEDSTEPPTEEPPTTEAPTTIAPEPCMAPGATRFCLESTCPAGYVSTDVFTCDSTTANCCEIEEPIDTCGNPPSFDDPRYIITVTDTADGKSATYECAQNPTIPPQTIDCKDGTWEPLGIAC